MRSMAKVNSARKNQSQARHRTMSVSNYKKGVGMRKGADWPAWPVVVQGQPRLPRGTLFQKKEKKEADIKFPFTRRFL